MIRVLLVGAGALVVLGALAWGFQRQLIYYPDRSPVPAAADVIPGARDVELHTSDGLVLGAWLVPPSGADRGVSVLVAPGNAGDRSGRASLAQALSAEGLQVLLVDYRGYGGNPGSPSEDGLARDVRAARDFLVEEAGVAPERILYLGESLGTAVVTELAAEHPPGAMLLRSPFTDLAAVGARHYPFLPVGALLRDRFPLVEHLADVEVPVTVVYGDRDTLIPPEQSLAVADAAPDLRQVVAVEGAGHNDPVMFDGDDLVDAVVDLADLLR